jgi:hypothetical protein
MLKKNLFYCQLGHFQLLQSLLLSVQISHYSFIWRPRLHLMKKLYALDILPQTARLSFSNNNSVSHGTPRCLYNPKFHCAIHKSSQLGLNFTQRNPVQTLPPYFCKIHFNIILHQHLVLSIGVYPSGFPINRFS